MSKAALIRGSRSTRFYALPLLLCAGFIAACDSGTDPGDTTPPALVSAASDGQVLTLILSEEVSAATIGDKAFSISPGEYELEEATLVGTRQVTLEIEDWLPNAPPTTYTVTTTGIADLAGNVASSLSATFSFGREAPVVGAALALGQLSQNPDRLFLFSADGTQYRVWSYAASGAACSATLTFPQNFGGGGSPIGAVGAGFYVDGGYLLFDAAGTSYTIYLGGGRFTEVRTTADLGDGTLSFG